MKSLKDTKDEKRIVLDKDSQRPLIRAEHESLINRLQKILTASYLVTNLLPEGETLGLSLRAALRDSLRSLFQSLHQGELKRQSFYYKKSLYSLLEASSYLDVLYGASLISEMNYTILHSEISSVQAVLTELSDEKNSDQGFSLESLFEKSNATSLPSHVLPGLKTVVYQEKQESSQQEKVQQEKLKTKKEEKKVYKVDNPQLVPELRHVKKPSFQKTSVQRDQKKAPLSGAKQLVKSKRQDIIVNLLKQQGESSITDICEHIDGCSSKTVQRDLNEMISTGAIMKKGDRRWSTYSLK